MRGVFGALLVGGALMPFLGCEPPKPKEFDGPTIDKFVGTVVQEGKAVKFPEDEAVQVHLFLVDKDKANEFQIPIKADGSFKITWMPIGKYGAILERKSKAMMRPIKFPLPEPFRIEKDKTEYVFELGPDWKP
jgi:hypothetical protein